MKNYFCEMCEEHWTTRSDNPKCPHCGEEFEIRPTMPPEEAERLKLK